MPILKILLQALDRRAGDQPPEGVEVGPGEQALEDGGKRALPLEDEQHFMRGIEPVLEARQAFAQGDDMPVELAHHPASVDPPVRFQQEQHPPLLCPQSKDPVRPEERFPELVGEFRREVDAGELLQALPGFRTAVPPRHPEVLVVELDRVAVFLREAVEFDAEIDGEPPVRDIGQGDGIAARVEDGLGIGLTLFGDDIRAALGEVIQAGDATGVPIDPCYGFLSSRPPVCR